MGNQSEQFWLLRALHDTHVPWLPRDCWALNPCNLRKISGKKGLWGHLETLICYVSNVAWAMWALGMCVTTMPPTEDVTMPGKGLSPSPCVSGTHIPRPALQPSLRVLRCVRVYPMHTEKAEQCGSVDPAQKSRWAAWGRVRCVRSRCGQTKGAHAPSVHTGSPLPVTLSDSRITHLLHAKPELPRDLRAWRPSRSIRGEHQSARDPIYFSSLDVCGVWSFSLWRALTSEPFPPIKTLCNRKILLFLLLWARHPFTSASVRCLLL